MKAIRAARYHTHGLAARLALGALLCVAGCRSPEPDARGWVYFPKALSGTDGPVTAMAARDSILYVSGNFKLAGNAEARNIARWDGHAWSALGEGVENPAQLIAVDGKGVVYAYSREAYPALMRWDSRDWKPIADSVGGGLTDLV